MPVVFGTFLIWLLLLLLLLLLFPSVRRKLKISEICVSRQFLCERALLIFVRCTRVKICFTIFISVLLHRIGVSNLIRYHCDNMLTLVNFCFVPYRYLFFTLLLCSYPYSRFACFETIAAKRFLYKSCVLC